MEKQALLFLGKKKYMNTSFFSFTFFFAPTSQVEENRLRLWVLPHLVSPQEESAVYCISKNPVMD